MSPAFGRFARARGGSLFARSFNQDLPRRMSSALGFSMSRPKFNFAEKPLNGFAEQYRLAQLLTGSLASPSADAEASDPVDGDLLQVLEDALICRKFFDVAPTICLQGFKRT
jgi:hypothetical protein